MRLSPLMEQGLCPTPLTGVGPRSGALCGPAYEWARRAALFELPVNQKTARKIVFGLYVPTIHAPRLGEGGFGDRLIANSVFNQRHSLMQRVVPLVRRDQEPGPPVLNRLAEREGRRREGYCSADRQPRKTYGRTCNW